MSQPDKIIYYMRHAAKGPNGHITPEGRQAASQIKLKELDRYWNGNNLWDAFCGPLARTEETLEAITSNNRELRFFFHDPIQYIGSPELFGPLVTPEYKAAISTGMDEWDALTKCHSEDDLDYYEGKFALAIIDMLANMNGTRAIAIGHNPIIPMVARAFGLSDAHGIKELECIQFNCWMDCTIKATWLA